MVTNTETVLERLSLKIENLLTHIGQRLTQPSKPGKRDHSPIFRPH
jgi:hypothetical protein